jgi:hypothetical protein
MTAPRLRHRLKIYGAYQLAGLGLCMLSVLAMLAADQSVLTREPRLPLIYLVGLAVLFGALGVFKAWRTGMEAR